MNNWFIGCITGWSFSAPITSILSLCSGTFSGLGVLTISISPVLWTSFSGLLTPAMNNWFIGCIAGWSFSAPITSILSLCSGTFSGLGVLTISISPVLWTSFSGLLTPAMNNWFIGCIAGWSFSAPITSILSLCSGTFSGLGVLTISISLDLWMSFSGFSNPATYNASINCLTNGSLSSDTISILSLCSISFSGFFVFSNWTLIVSSERLSQGLLSPSTYI